MQHRLFIFISFICMLTACSNNEDTTPSMADKDRMEQLIDSSIQQIVDFRDAYGTYILYKFDKSLDFAYQFEQASNWTNASLTEITHDEAEAAVDMLSENIFNCYSDDFKKKYFPRKLLLVGEIASTNELGLSFPSAGIHVAVANMNSVTFGCMNTAGLQQAFASEDLLFEQNKERHRALLCDYLVVARNEYPVAQGFFDISQSYYSALMDSRRKQASQILADDPEFFLNRGFMTPDDAGFGDLESTYFVSGEEDLTNYIRMMINMDKDMADSLMLFPLVADKMHLVCTGLQEMGVDVMTINPDVEQFLTMEPVQSAVMYVGDAVTDNPKANLDVTIMRGSHDLEKLVVVINGNEQSEVDLTEETKMRIQLSVGVEELVKGANTAEIRLYEQGRDRAALTVTTVINYATLEAVEGFAIKCSADKEAEMSRRLKFSYGSDEVLHPDNRGIERNPLLTTIAFEKHGWLDRYLDEHDFDYRGWKLYKDEETGLVTKILELERGFNETYTALIYKLICTYDFIYDEEGTLQRVDYTLEGEEPVTIVNNVVTNGNRIAQFDYKGTTYTPTYTTINGITARVDILDEELSGNIFNFAATETLNPYYMPELPAVIPGSVAEIPLQIFYSQYLFTSISSSTGTWQGTWTDGWVKNLPNKTNTASVTIDDVTWQYIFKLK